MNSRTRSAPESSQFKCLLLEDDPGFAVLAGQVIGHEGGLVVHCASIREAKAAIEKHVFDLAVIDNILPDGTGYEFFPLLQRRFPAIVTIMSTGQPELRSAVALTRNGLFDYLSKPMSADTLADCVHRAKQRMGCSQEDPSTEMSGESPVIREVLQMLQQASRHPTATVLLIGETGTGKDLAARTLHRLTFPDSADGSPYVALNCSTLPETMFEAELFGAEKGSYTGADRRRVGLAEAARNGTLFLDEIGEVPLSQQPKLLRFLESREYRPIGSSETRQFHGRVVAATNRMLLEEVIAGRLRADLMYRLDVFTVRLPPLRDRIDDLDRIASALVRQLGEKYGRKTPFIQPSDLAALHEYDFPGNIRELRNILERSLLRTPPDASWLAMDLGWLQPRQAGAHTSANPPGTTLYGVSHGPAPAPSSRTSSSPAPGATPSTPSADPASSDPAVPRTLNPIDLQEYRLIAETLKLEGGAIRRSATRLGLTHQALLRRLQKWPELRPRSDSNPESNPD